VHNTKKLVKELEELKVIDVIRSDNMIYNKSSNKPISEVNKYKYNLLSIIYGKNETDNKNIFRVCDKNCTNCFNACLCTLYSDKQLKELLTKDFYYKLKEFKINDYNKLPCIAC